MTSQSTATAVTAVGVDAKPTVTSTTSVQAVGTKLPTGTSKDTLSEYQREERDRDRRGKRTTDRYTY